MPTIRIEVSDEQLQAVQRDAQANQFTNVDAYVHSLVVGRHVPPPPHLSVTSDTHLAQLLQEGLDSGTGQEMTDEYLNDLRERVTRSINEVAARQKVPA